MTVDQMRQLLFLLREFEREVGCRTMPKFEAGEWSRRNLEAMIEDVHTVSFLADSTREC